MSHFTSYRIPSHTSIKERAKLVYKEYDFDKYVATSPDEYNTGCNYALHNVSISVHNSSGAKSIY